MGRELPCWMSISTSAASDRLCLETVKGKEKPRVNSDENYEVKIIEVGKRVKICLVTKVLVWLHLTLS